MTLRHLKFFISVCNNNSFTKAAEELHVAQPAVSKAISELERYYKIQLFERINQRIVITEAGKEMLVKAKEVIQGFEDFESFALKGRNSLEVRIGTSLTVGKSFIPKFLKKIYELYPEGRVEVIIQKTGIIEEKILNGSLDFGIIEGRVSKNMFNAYPLSKDKLVAVCSRELSIPDSMNLDELLNYNLILREQGSASRELLDSLFDLRHLSLNPVIESASYQAILAAVNEGLGIAVIPEGMLPGGKIIKQLKRIDIQDVSLEREYNIITHKNKKFNTFKSKVYGLAFDMYK